MLQQYDIFYSEPGKLKNNKYQELYSNILGSYYVQTQSGLICVQYTTQNGTTYIHTYNIHIIYLSLIHIQMCIRDSCNPIHYPIFFYGHYCIIRPITRLSVAFLSHTYFPSGQVASLAYQPSSFTGSGLRPAVVSIDSKFITNKINRVNISFNKKTT